MTIRMLLSILLIAVSPISAFATEDSEIKSPDGLNKLPVLGVGDPNAPVYLVEFASLSCGGCQSFHNEILPQIKEDFVDTGKVFIEFREFPTSQSAFAAAKLMRCLPESRQYKFMDLLFQTQEQWAFTQDTAPLFQNAKLAGLSQEKIDSCLSDKDLETKILEGVQAARASYNVSSTPTVIMFPENVKLKGLNKYKTIKKQIQRALATTE